MGVCLSRRIGQRLGVGLQIVDPDPQVIGIVALDSMLSSMAGTCTFGCDDQQGIDWLTAVWNAANKSVEIYLDEEGTN